MMATLFRKLDSKGPLIVLVDSFPSVSETFIYEEISALEDHGYPVTVVSLRPREECDTAIGQPTSRIIQYGPQLGVTRYLHYLIAGLLAHPFATCRELGQAAKCVPPNLRGLWRAARAVVISRRLTAALGPIQNGHIHAHFLHRTALVGKLLAQSLNCTYSLSGHGRDVFSPDFQLDRLSDHASFIAVCSQHAQKELTRQLVTQNRQKIVRCYHGLDLDRFRDWRLPRQQLSELPRVLSVCRLVEKKGLDTVIQALSLLASHGKPAAYRIIGGGPEEKRLRHLTQAAGLKHVEFLGTLPPERTRQFYQQADLFVLGCRVASDGDRDGIPNAILEAMAMGLPVVATNVGGISEIITDRQTGCLVPPDDPKAMADAFETLLQDANLRIRIARQAREQVVARFDIRNNIACFISHLNTATRRSASCEQLARTPVDPCNQDVRHREDLDGYY